MASAASAMKHGARIASRGAGRRGTRGRSLLAPTHRRGHFVAVGRLPASTLLDRAHRFRSTEAATRFPPAPSRPQSVALVISCDGLSRDTPMLACAAAGSIPSTRQHQSKPATSSDPRAIQARALFLSSSDATPLPRQIFTASLRSAVQRRCSAVDDREIVWGSARGTWNLTERIEPRKRSVRQASAWTALT